MDLHLYSAIQVYRLLKGLYNICHIPPFSHNAKDFKLIHHITEGGGSSSR